MSAPAARRSQDLSAVSDARGRRADPARRVARRSRPARCTASWARAAPASRPSPGPCWACCRATVRVTGGRDPARRRGPAGASTARRCASCSAPTVALIPQDPLTALNPEPPHRGADHRRPAHVEGAVAPPRRATRALALLDEVQMREPERVLRAYPARTVGRHAPARADRRRLRARAQARHRRRAHDRARRDGAEADPAADPRHAGAARHRRCCSSPTTSAWWPRSATASPCSTRGTVMEQGATAGVLAAPRHPYTRALLAASPRYDRPGRGAAPVPEAVFGRMPRRDRGLRAARGPAWLSALARSRARPRGRLRRGAGLIGRSAAGVRCCTASTSRSGAARRSASWANPARARRRSAAPCSGSCEPVRRHASPSTASDITRRRRGRACARCAAACR